MKQISLGVSARRTLDPAGTQKCSRPRVSGKGEVELLKNGEIEVDADVAFPVMVVASLVSPEELTFLASSAHTSNATIRSPVAASVMPVKVEGSADDGMRMVRRISSLASLHCDCS